MNAKNKNYSSLLIFIVALILIGAIIGSLIKPEVNTWYGNLARSPLTPANYVFSIAWTFLYTIIAICGWIIWRAPWFFHLKFLKFLYAIQLILNWSWAPLFFCYHLIGFSFSILVIMSILVSMIIYLAYQNIRSVSLLMIPYLLWILFATYLNFYIWQHN